MNTAGQTTDLPAIQPERLFLEALQALMDLARTTDKDHIKLRALLEIARLCRPAAPAAAPCEPRPSGRGRPAASIDAPTPPPPTPSHTSASSAPSAISAFSPPPEPHPNSTRRSPHGAPSGPAGPAHAHELGPADTPPPPPV